MGIFLHALAALVFIHLQTAFFLEVTHGAKEMLGLKLAGQAATRTTVCKAHYPSSRTRRPIAVRTTSTRTRSTANPVNRAATRPYSSSCPR